MEKYAYSGYGMYFGAEINHLKRVLLHCTEISINVSFLRKRVSSG